jgi:GTPase
MEEIKKIDTGDRNQLRIGVLGNVDSGKTTLISVVSNNILDNGRGLARKRVLKHNHEQESGRTSSITHTYYRTGKERIISFVDLAGHEKYYKTTIFGANCCSLDYLMVLVGANMGVSLMTREHLLLTFILKLPFMIVITKTDIAPKNVLENTIRDIERVIKKYKPEHKLAIISNEEDFSNFPKAHLNNRKEVPYMMISNTNGTNLPLLKNYFNYLEIYHDWRNLTQQQVYLTIEDTYLVNGVGVVVSGTITQGTIEKGKRYMLGPIDGRFLEVTVKSLHDNYKQTIDVIEAGCSGCLCIKSHERKTVLKKSMLRRGMLMISKNHDRFTTYKFQATVKILHHPTTIKKNYESIIHCGSIRQAARIIEIDKDLLRTGDQSTVTFQFKCRPEFIQTEKQIMFREGKTKGIGVVTKIL